LLVYAEADAKASKCVIEATIAVYCFHPSQLALRVIAMTARPTRSFGRKVSFGFSIFSLICSLISAGVCIWFYQTKGAMDVLTGSAIAATLFFVSVAVSLYFISKPPLHVLLPWDAPEP
jgi:hypothetical protein